MARQFRQARAVAILNLKSIPQRAAMSFSAVLAIAIAVAVLLGFLSLSDGFRRTMEGGGSDEIAIVLRAGSETELNSVLSLEQTRLVAAAPGIAQGRDGPLVSSELYLVLDAKKRDGEKANLTFRGVGEVALAVRPNVRLAEGRMFTPGTNEIVVGRGLMREFEGFTVGHDIELGRKPWSVVGVFEAPGSAVESELWVDARVAQDLFRRGRSYQSVRAALSSPAAFERLRDSVEGDPRLPLEVRTERTYLESRAGATNALIVNIGGPLALIMAVGALVAALNTIYASVSARATEVATLRMIGFSGFSAFAGTMAEAVALSLGGAVVGLVAYFLLFGGMTTSTVAQGSLTQVVFELSLTPELAGQAIAVALAIGIFGGLLPGWRSARTSLPGALGQPQ